MKQKMNKAIWMALAITLVLAVAPTTWSSVGVVRSAECVFEPVAMPDGPGPVELRLSFKPIHKCDEVTVTITKLWNIEYSGDMTWTVEVEKGTWYERILDLTIPANDTCGIELDVKCGRIPNDLYAYFVTTGDTVVFQPANPRYNHPLKTTSKYNHSDPILDTMTAEVLAVEYDVLVNLRRKSDHDALSRVLGYSPELDRKGYARITLSLSKMIPLDKEIDFECKFFDPPVWMGRNAKVPDDFQFEYTEPVKDTIPKTVMLAKAVNFPTETEQERMNRLQQQPLIGAPLQTIRVGGVRYRRYRGETEFKKVEPIDPDQRATEVANTMDSINSLPITADLDIGLPLGNPDHLATARTIVDSLISSDEPGHYFTRTTKGKIKELQDQGIRVILLDTIPHSRSYWPGYNTRNK